MNELDPRALVAIGAPQWYTITLYLSKNAVFVEFDVGAFYVVDNLFQSEIIASKVGECSHCDDCNTDFNDPQCQYACLNLPANSCAFDGTCLESILNCGPSGFPLASGLTTCNRFQNNLNKFSTDDRARYVAAEKCLQQLLVPCLTCDSICDAVKSTRFDNILSCYSTSGIGFCNLFGMYYVYVLSMIDSDDYHGALHATVASAAGCASQIGKNITAALQQKLHDAV
jgi:hypothetical protein